MTPEEPTPSDPTVTVLAQNLDSPRGITVGPDGQLYVAEAGRGPAGGYDPSQPVAASPSVPGAQLQYGTTGAIARINPDSGAISRILTGLPSVAIPANEPVFAAPFAADALGPTDITFSSDGQVYFLIGLGTDPANRDVLGAPQLGFLVTADLLASNPNGSVSYLADIADYESLNNPDGTDVISNPYSVAVQGSQVLIIDAGANVLLTTDRNGGGLGLRAIFNDVRLFPNPGIPGLPDPLPMQQVPTGITLGPDGIPYVSELTGLPFPVGEARILTVMGSQVSTALSGFTNLVDIEFDQEGNLWVLEYDSDSILGGQDLGALIRVSPSGERTIILADLATPTSVAVGPDGSVYVANNGFLAGVGEIIKVSF
ncbi:MAG: ScyD/ScyE family protein [Synechococcaceae cyanobacterium SM2_3_2]|nr:ScyD/ScyE family protein [Synechococcaceae cyanobacterium SM2_3_2]